MCHTKRINSTQKHTHKYTSYNIHVYIVGKRIIHSRYMYMQYDKSIRHRIVCTLVHKTAPQSECTAGWARLAIYTLSNWNTASLTQNWFIAMQSLERAPHKPPNTCVFVAMWRCGVAATKRTIFSNVIFSSRTSSL